MKRIVILVASMALVAAGFQVVPAAAAGAEDSVKYFLRSTGCSAADVNFDYLSITDADEEVECNYTAAGARYELGAQTGTVEVEGQRPLASREDATRYFDSTDGGTVTLDASRPVTGTIFTSGVQCAPVEGGPCGPVSASAGEVILDITLVGKIGDEEVELGAQTDTFQTPPAAPHATEVSIQPDAAHSGKTFDVIELRTWVHGKSQGHGLIRTNGDFSSFISVPTKAAGKTPPGKNNPPGTKKGCAKGKGKKRGCEGKGKKSPKPGKPSAACAPLKPATAGAEAPSVTLTDSATAEKPLIQPLTLEQRFDEGLGDAVGAPGSSPAAPASVNVQVDTNSKSPVGLYATFEFPDYRDYDLWAYFPGTENEEAASSHGFQPAIETQGAPAVGPVGLDNSNTASNHGGESTATSENLVGILTPDCGGYTISAYNYLGEGGEMELKLWLGEVKYDPADTPAAEGAQAAYDAMLLLF